MRLFVRLTHRKSEEKEKQSCFACEIFIIPPPPTGILIEGGH